MGPVAPAGGPLVELCRDLLLKVAHAPLVAEDLIDIKLPRVQVCHPAQPHQVRPAHRHREGVGRKHAGHGEHVVDVGLAEAEVAGQGGNHLAAIVGALLMTELSREDYRADGDVGASPDLVNALVGLIAALS